MIWWMIPGDAQKRLTSECVYARASLVQRICKDIPNCAIIYAWKVINRSKILNLLFKRKPNIYKNDHQWK